MKTTTRNLIRVMEDRKTDSVNAIVHSAIAKQKQCDGKIRHNTPEQAEVQRARLNRMFRSIVHVYHCEYCNGYHVGHSNQERVLTEQLRPKRILVS